MYFSALRVGDREVPLHHVFSQRDQAEETGRVTMRPGERLLSVEFAALDFSAPEKNQYAFRIEEQGGKWNDLGTRRQITFSNLGVGEHTLRIKGSNNDGVWNEKGVALRIEVLPALWQTWWFKLLALFLLAGAAMLIYAVCRTIASLKKIAAPPNLDEIFNKHKISHREQEILHLVIQGKSNREMEDALFISLPTVKRHLANIYEKIGVSSRLQLINFLRGRTPHYLDALCGLRRGRSLIYSILILPMVALELRQPHAGNADIDLHHVRVHAGDVDRGSFPTEAEDGIGHHIEAVELFGSNQDIHIAMRAHPCQMALVIHPDVHVTLDVELPAVAAYQ
jgi:DNA-binding CsgD family transcriptional regulator